MSTLNPILAGSAQSVEAYQQVIEQTSQAVVQWLKQPEMYQGKALTSCVSVSPLNLTNRVWVTGRRLIVRSSTS